jgi:AcrR family transcriptional regulator
VTSRTRLSASDRREQLLDVTQEIVDEQGFHAVSIEAVARRAGITRPVVYGHFGDLPGLLEAVFERETVAALAQLADIVPTDLGTGDPRGRLLAGLRGYLEAVGANPGRWRTVLMPPEGAPELLREHITRGREAVVAVLAAAVQAESDAGVTWPDPPLTGRLLSAISDDYARLHLLDPAEYPVDRLIAHADWALGALVR